MTLGIVMMQNYDGAGAGLVLILSRGSGAFALAANVVQRKAIIIEPLHAQVTYLGLMLAAAEAKWSGSGIQEHLTAATHRRFRLYRAEQVELHGSGSPHSAEKSSKKRQSRSSESSSGSDESSGGAEFGGADVRGGPVEFKKRANAAPL